MTLWYVRPDTSHSTTRDGTSYANAYGGWASITWGAGGVTAGDTLYVCGNFHSGNTLSIGAHLGTSGNNCTISGDYADDPGRITFTGAVFLNNTRSYTVIRNLNIVADTSNCIYISATVSDVQILDNTLTANGAPHISISGNTGTAHVDIVIDGNTFTGTTYSGTGSSGALQWFVSATSAVSTITRARITNNTFRNVYSGRAVIHFRTEDDTDVASRMEDIICEYNIFDNVYGKPMEFSHGHNILAVGAGLRVRYNTIINAYATTNGNVIGGNTYQGFGASAALGIPEIAYNTYKVIQGPAGVTNVFWGTYNIHDEYAKDIYTNTIDGNGLLFDHGATNCKAWANTYINIHGLAGVSNSGVGIMVLDAPGTECWGNKIINTYVGIHLGSASGAGQSALLYNNTFVDCGLYGIDIKSSADRANCVVKNNIFIGKRGASSSVVNLGAAWSAETYNNFYGFAAPSGHTLGTGTTITDPELSATYELVSSSQEIGAGIFVGYVNDNKNKQFWNPPSKGAIEYERPRIPRA